MERLDTTAAEFPSSSPASTDPASSPASTDPASSPASSVEDPDEGCAAKKYISRGKPDDFYMPPEGTSMFKIWEKFEEGSGTSCGDFGASRCFKVEVDGTRYIFKINRSEGAVGDSTEREVNNMEELKVRLEKKGDHCFSLFSSSPLYEKECNPDLIIFEDKSIRGDISQTCAGVPYEGEKTAPSFIHDLIVKNEINHSHPCKDFYHKLFLIMECMDDLNMYHRDIKSGNFILTEDGPQLIDFAGIIFKDDITKEWWTESYGEDITPDYIPPFYSTFSQLLSDDWEEGVKDKIELVLRANDRYAFLLMLVENALDISSKSNWTKFFAKKYPKKLERLPGLIRSPFYIVDTINVPTWAARIPFWDN